MTLFKRLKQKVHHHVDENGKLIKCYHDTKSVIASPGFWAGTILSTVLSFPFEHYLYEKVWPFYKLTEFLGL